MSGSTTTTKKPTKSYSFHEEHHVVNRPSTSYSFHEEGRRNGSSANQHHPRPHRRYVQESSSDGDDKPERVVPRPPSRKYIQQSSDESSSPVPVPKKQLVTTSPPTVLSAKATSSAENTSSEALKNAQVTIEKYKQLYEAILRDPSNAFLFEKKDTLATVASEEAVAKKEGGEVKEIAKDRVVVHGADPPEVKEVDTTIQEKKDPPATNTSELSEWNSNVNVDEIIEGLKLQDILNPQETPSVGSQSILSEIKNSSSSSSSSKNDRQLAPIKPNKRRISSSLNSSLRNSHKSASSTDSHHSHRSHSKSERKRSNRSLQDHHYDRERTSSTTKNEERRSRSSFNLTRSASPGNVSSGTSVSSQKSNKSRSSSTGRNLSFGSRRRFSFSSNAGGSVADDLESQGGFTDCEDDGDVVGDLYNASGTDAKKGKKGLFGKMRKLGAKVSNGVSKVFLPGGSMFRKYKVGEKARYNIGKIRDSLETFDPCDLTVEVTIIAVHIDAVLEIPYYTIQLPDGSRKQTNMEHLMPLEDYNNGRRAESRLGHHRHRSSSRSRSTSRSRSSLVDNDDDQTSVRSNRSTRSTNSSKSLSSRRSSSKRGSSRRSPSPERDSSRRRSISKRHSSKPRDRDRSGSPKRSSSRHSSSRRLSEHSSSFKSTSSSSSRHRMKTPPRSRNGGCSSRCGSDKLSSTRRSSRRCIDEHNDSDYRPRIDAMRGGGMTIPSSDSVVSLKKSDRTVKSKDPQRANDETEEKPTIIKLTRSNTGNSMASSSFALEAAALAIGARRSSASVSSGTKGNESAKEEPPAVMESMLPKAKHSKSSSSDDYELVKSRDKSKRTRSRSIGAPASPVKNCSKCDGSHESSDCPTYLQEREKHKDAWRHYGKKDKKHMGEDGGNVRVKAKRITQPPDGSCLFHSLVHCLNTSKECGGVTPLSSFSNTASSYVPPPLTATYLRRKVASYIASNPELPIADDPLKEWVLWESGKSVKEYAAEIKKDGVWGGGVEIAAVSHMFNVNVHVYERKKSSDEYLRISCFNVDSDVSKKTLHILYQGRNHYDALQLK
ncbi:predicted protein [Thalassiosira pseudonana CCMP1335]|uniref:Ubiquitin thioesterase OTU n=1 Tax=Thalassiosira pseudonana TaxID=35128 RepID=B8LD83_THAPS|nr:predicted protein [Thalassiosira pseudonana CCMP1335]EED86668.1 predicted protein [Thalassiosira pseudonana CCMP1335]